MTTWNYRTVHHFEDGEDTYMIYEIYYDDDLKIVAWAETEASPFGETVEELKQDLLLMAEACEKPILEASELPE